MAQIGFIGLGIMGQPMALNILKGGHRLALYSRSGVPASLLEVGGIACAAGAEVARLSDVIILMVPDTPDVQRVLFGPDGVADGLSAGKTVIDMSSISPLATKSFAERVEQLGCRYLDAPVSGGEIGAKSGTLTIMVGGPQAVFEQVRPLFDVMGKNVTFIGNN